MHRMVTKQRDSRRHPKPRPCRQHADRLRFIEDVAPGSLRRLNTHAQEAQRGFGDNRLRSAESERDEHRRERVRQDIFGHNRAVARADRTAASTYSHSRTESTLP